MVYTYMGVKGANGQITSQVVPHTITQLSAIIEPESITRIEKKLPLPIIPIRDSMVDQGSHIPRPAPALAGHV